MCRQLRQDTLRLELAYNDTLTFFHSAEFYGYQNFVWFYDHLPAMLKKRIRKVNAIERAFPWDIHMPTNSKDAYEGWHNTLTGQGPSSALYHICLANSELHVVLRYDQFETSCSPLGWLVTTCALLWGLRGFPLDINIGLSVDEAIESTWKYFFFQDQHLVGDTLANLRMSVTWGFDEEALRKVDLPLEDAVEIDLEKRIAEARRMFEEGV